MLLRTDDDIYRARLLWLGPPGYPLPVQLPYAEWFLFGLICLVLLGLDYVITGGFALFGEAVGASMISTSLIWRHVDPDRPAFKIIRTVGSDWRRVRGPLPAGPLPRMSARRVRIGES